jgi:hypothetical protein
MYDLHRLEWHLGVELEDRPPQVSVWSCKVAGEAFASSSNRQAAALPRAKTTEHLAGVFAFGDRTPHDSKHPNRGGAEEKRSWYAARLGGSSRIIQSAGRIIKPRGIRYPIRSMMIPQGGETFPLYSNGVGGSLGEIY